MSKAIPRVESVADDNAFDDSPIAASTHARTHTNPKEIMMAYGRIRRYFKKPTALKPAPTLMPGWRAFVKEEYTFRTGSFKERGALNALLLLNDEERQAGVIVASAGNHSSAMAFHAQRLNVPLTVYMPTVAPLTKVNQCMSFGAEVILHGENLSIARDMAMSVAAERGVTYINGFNDPAIVNGAASCGIEILEQLPDVEAIIIGVGGGGLIAGVAAAAKQRNPSIKIIGVESSSCPSMSAALKEGRPVKVDTMPTLADGAQVPTVGPHAFEVAKDLIDECVVVDEKWICLAIVRAMETLKVTLEGGGALGVAAMLSGQLDHLKNLKTVFVGTGGNIDITTLGRVIERGLYADQRLLRFSASLSDSPGALVAFLQVVAELGCSVKDIQQERCYIQEKSVRIRTLIETRTKEHTAQLLARLKELDYEITVENDSGKYKRPPTPTRSNSSANRSPANEVVSPGTVTPVSMAETPILKPPPSKKSFATSMNQI